MIVKLHNVRASFFNGFEAVAFKPGDPLRFKSTFLISKNSPQIKEIEQAIEKAAVEKWGAKAKSILNSIRGNANKFCFQDGDNKDYDGYKGMMALTASSRGKPLILDRDKSPLTAADGRPYSGCYVNCSLDIFAYNNSGSGISASLRGVQFYKDGDAFSGGAPADESEFENVGDFGGGETEAASGLL